MADTLDRALLEWYDSRRRDLPWRRQRDPYRIWVSEVMLQQTRVETAIPYYLRWLERFPDLLSLARAPEEEVLALWSGLGYYSRARNLHAAVREVASRYGGEVPRDPDAFAALPGVGEYTAGAVLSIAYGLRLPAVDGNALRVLVRLGALEGDITRTAVRREAVRLAARLVPEDRPGDFNQALMELGGSVCVPRRPRCGDCPITAWCEARRRGLEGVLPRRTRRPAAPAVPLAAALIRDGSGRVGLARRPAVGLLAGMWGLPAFEVGAETPAGAVAAALERHLEEAHGLRVRVGPPVARARHVFSHRTWEMTAFAGDLLEAPPEGPGWRWLTPGELEGFPLPRAFSRLVEAAGLVPAAPAGRPERRRSTR
ncbi:A/G-specific adenine glycosylase [Caldinitratiruptor microaerophilus]|uniref:Adenine DNA glycosylase n=1 Tax=Caldinitratiruptor microaerophilus TaxID=671077 RepID=A0AA35CIT1_9FIRM|nr:A/G-specific adenine glycosylase [Caldinitratiruptor microaerophilus]BDG59999.1 A/G-specific adenine glycosylase [Caldinitratiruptor microaerophilus]